MYSLPLDKTDMLMQQLNYEDRVLPYNMRIIPIKVEPPVLPASPRNEAPKLPRTAVVRNMFLGAVYAVTQGAVNLAKL